MVVDAVEDLDAGATLVAFGDLRRVRDRAERDILVLATHLADLYHPDAAHPDRPRVLPGTERGVRLGGEGTPPVLEFAIAEMAAELGITTYRARHLIGDGLEARHRLPKTWARMHAGEVPAWITQKIAQATRPLTRAQAAFVDDQLHKYADGRLPWPRFAAKLEAAVIEADPDAAAARERAAAAARFAKVGQSNDHGQKTLYVKTSAAEMTRIDASIAYLADALKALGDLDDEDRRRTKAVLLMANPGQALALLQALATHRSTTPTRDGASAADGDGPRPAPADPEGTSGPHGPGAPPWTEDDIPLPDPADLHPDGLGSDPPDPGPDPGPDDSGAATKPGTGATNDPDKTAPGAIPDTEAPDRSPQPGGAADPSPPDDGRPPAPGGAPTDPADACAADAAAPAAGSPDPLAGFFTPFHPQAVPTCPCRGGRFHYDTRKLLPALTVYLHIHADTLTRGNGVIRVEDLGPLSALYLRDFLGPHALINLKPVIDPAGLAPVDAYEIPDRHREALHLRTPADVFPYAPNTGRRKQGDHTVPYRSKANGGPPGQTSLDNLGGMTLFHHRVKTHGRWQVQQPFPGIYLWQSPHGSLFLVDHTGTRQIRRPHTTSRPKTAEEPPTGAATAETPAAGRTDTAPAAAAAGAADPGDPTEIAATVSPAAETDPAGTTDPTGTAEPPTSAVGDPSTSGIEDTPRRSALEDHFAALINAA